MVGKIGEKERSVISGDLNILSLRKGRKGICICGVFLRNLAMGGVLFGKKWNLGIWMWVMMVWTGCCVCEESSIHELLRRMGLPAGLVPKQVKSYTVGENGRLEVYLDGPCMAKYENRVIFDSVFSANLSYGSLIGVEGMSQEELFLWLPVKDIIVNYPTSGVILIDIGVAHKQLSLSLFEDPPDCNPQVALRNPLRKQRGFESLR